MWDTITWRKLGNADVAGEVDALRQDTLRVFLMLAVTSYLAWHILATLLAAPEDGLRRWMLFPVVVSGLAATYYLLGRGSRFAAGCFVATTVLSITAALWLLAAPAATLFYPVVALAAVILLNPLAGLVVSTGTLGLLALLRDAGPLAFLDAGRLVETAASSLLVVVSAWALGRNMVIAVGWALDSYGQASRNAVEARGHRGQLVQALQQLDHAYYQLGQANVALELAWKAAEAAERSKSDFATAVSHELRTPLNLVIGFSEMMVLSPRNYYGQALPETYRDDVEAIYRNASHISNLIDDILELSQVDAHRMGLKREDASLTAIAEEAAATVSSLFRDKGLDLEVDLPSDLPILSVDRTRVRQILINLLNNAVRFTDEGGVRIAARHDQREVVISVADTGIGIAPEDLPRVFQEFSQVGPAITRRYGGSGLGLMVSKRFAELHGGSMWVESHPGEGSTFYLSLPICGNVVATAVRPDREALARSQATPSARTIMLLDEDPEAVRIFERYLDGYRVVAAASFEQARQVARTTAPLALVVATPSLAEDWQQLQGDQQPLGSLPVIVCSLRTVRDTGKELGATEYLVKPITRDRLRAALVRLDLGKGPRTILVVDDDPEMVRLLTGMVGSISKRYQVIGADGGAQCLRLLREQPPDAVLLDLLMPGVDGYAVLAEMRADERLRQVPVVVVSAKGSTEEPVVARMVGVARPGGLTVGQAMRCVKSSLDALLTPVTPVAPVTSASQPPPVPPVTPAADGIPRASPAAPPR